MWGVKKAYSQGELQMISRTLSKGVQRHNQHFIHMRLLSYNPIKGGDSIGVMWVPG